MTDSDDALSDPEAVSTDHHAGLASFDDERSNCGVGCIVDLPGETTHETVADALELLENLEHRGTTGAETNTGDGAGIMVDRPDEFFREVVEADLPEEYGVGAMFVPTDPEPRAELERLVIETLAEYGLDTLAWREVPTDNTGLGATALESEPAVVQVFVAPADDADLAGRFTGEETFGVDTEPSLRGFDRALYAARRAMEKGASEREGRKSFYVLSLDRRRVVYKGLLKGEQLAAYYPDLTDPRFRCRVALVHARFSTNTLGAWHLAHPFRNIVHNGEFNTIEGNINWMSARENDLVHAGFGDDIETLEPIINDPTQSDTASVDNALELLVQTGRSLPHALRMLVPEAFREDHLMDTARKDFYDYHASLIEPWDGPALVIGFDGDQVAAVLDRNGLRPCRYELTTDDRLIIGSEVGALSTDAAEIRKCDRLQPGEIFVADLEDGRIVPDEEVFAELTDEQYGQWVTHNQIALETLVDGTEAASQRRDVERQSSDAGPGDVAEDDSRSVPVRAYQAAFGYTRDSLDHLVKPMAEQGKDPVGSMGDDTPLSVLTDLERPLFSYFKQLFAQVSNPPIDYIREELVTSLETRLGEQGNLLDETPAHAEQVVADSPLLTGDEAAILREIEHVGGNHGVSSTALDTTFDPEESLESAVAELRREASNAIEDGADLIVLTDRAAGPERLPIPGLLATGAVHHHLVREGLRNRAGLAVESGGAHEVHHVATLVGYGAGAVYPYLAYESIADVVSGSGGADEANAIAAYRDALEDGLLKTMAKMGISTVESYQGAQIFEAVGLDSGLVEEYFTGTEIRTEGIGLDVIEDRLRSRHARAFGTDPELDRIGEYENRSSGLYHGWNPNTVGTLQQAVRNGDYETYREFAALANGTGEDARTLRGLLAFDSDRDPVP
ncbi:glutamate synthase subunit alpha, partial [Halobacteriales archaeon QH_2_65_14]